MIQTITMRVMTRMKGWILMSWSRMNCMASVLLLDITLINYTPCSKIINLCIRTHRHTYSTYIHNTHSTHTKQSCDIM